MAPHHVVAHAPFSVLMCFLIYQHIEIERLFSFLGLKIPVIAKLTADCII